MAFWNLVSIEPKRTFRYLVTFGAANGVGGDKLSSQISMFATSVDRPKYEVSFKEFQYLNHQFNFPGRVKWSDITMKFVDAGRSGDATNPILDMAKLMMQVINNSGYVIPEDSSKELRTLSKAAFNKQIGDISIKILTADADNAQALTNDMIVEEWTLYNSMFGNATFSGLSYDNEEFSTIDLTVKYDYAKLTVFNGQNAPTQLPANPVR
jgi:hypothetical protein